jgi:hypothetical protein
VDETTLTELAAIVPNETVAPLEKFVPVIVTVCPPAVGPDAGVTLETDGTGAAGMTLGDGADTVDVPRLLVATTLKVYAVPLARPVTVADNVEPSGVVTVAPPGLAVTVYDVIGEPPLLAGAFQLTVTAPLPAAPTTAVGGPGGPVGVTLADGADAADGPTPLLATTVNVYAVPFVRPLTFADNVVPSGVVAVAPPGLAVTVYDVIGEPPLSAGAAQFTVTAPLPAVAVTAVGAIPG